VRPMIETRPLEQAAEAYERMMSGAARSPHGAEDRRLKPRPCQREPG
jgi:hypothetical protein